MRKVSSLRTVDFYLIFFCDSPLTWLSLSKIWVLVENWIEILAVVLQIFFYFFYSWSVERRCVVNTVDIGRQTKSNIKEARTSIRRTELRTCFIFFSYTFVFIE